jgi:hypothetical protein
MAFSMSHRPTPLFGRIIDQNLFDRLSVSFGLVHPLRLRLQDNTIFRAESSEEAITAARPCTRQFAPNDGLQLNHRLCWSARHRPNL